MTNCPKNGEMSMLTVYHSYLCGALLLLTLLLRGGACSCGCPWGCWGGAGSCAGCNCCVGGGAMRRAWRLFSLKSRKSAVICL